MARMHWELWFISLGCIERMACDKSYLSTVDAYKFFLTMVQYLSEGQQIASLREGKPVWETHQADYTDPPKWTPEGWKCILTGVEIAWWMRALTIMAPKWLTMNIHFNSTNVSTSAWSLCWIKCPSLQFIAKKSYTNRTLTKTGIIPKIFNKKMWIPI